MKVCHIVGDMSAEKSSEAYPTEVFCDECYDKMNVHSADNPIIAEEPHDSTWADFCSSCGKTVDEEKQEQAG